MAKDYESLIVGHFDKLSESIARRNASEKKSLVKALTEEWEFERVFTATMAYIGELSGKLGSSYRTEYTSIDWAGLRIARNVVSHDYEATNLNRLVNIFYNSVIPLVEIIKSNTDSVQGDEVYDAAQEKENLIMVPNLDNKDGTDKQGEPTISAVKF